MRINKFLAEAGIASRRASEDLIKKGRIFINGKKINQLSIQVDPDKDEIFFDKQKLKLSEKKYYILLNKPKGYVCSNYDSFNKLKARDLIKIDAKLFSVGRLDINTEGLILFTNDGALANSIMHPKYKIEKKYIVIINKCINIKDIKKIQNGGIKLEEGLTLPANIKVLNDAGNKIELGIFEGRKRQIRRVFKKLNYKVIDLKRVSIGKIELGNLELGKYRNVTDIELKFLIRRL